MDIFKIFGKIVINGANEAENEIKGITGVAQKASEALLKVGKVAGTALAAAGTAVATISKFSLDAYADYEQLVGGVETLFKDSSTQLQTYAQRAFQTAGLSANEYMETATSFSASLLQSLGNDTAKAVEYADMAIQDMADNANKMGTDMTAIQNAYQGFAKQNYAMLDNLKLGYGGTKEEMKRLLKTANEINKRQGIITNYSIESYADIVAAIHVVQEEMGIYGTTALEASETISGSLNSAKAAWKNLLVGFADGGQDMDLLLGQFVGSVTTAAENIVPRLAQILGGISDALAQIMPVISAELPALLEQLLPGVISGAASLVTGVAEALPEIMQILVEELTNVISQLWDEVSKINTVQTLIDWFAEIGSYISTEFAPIFGDLSSAIQTVKDAVQPVIDKLKDYITSGEAAEDATNLLKDAISFVADAYETAKGFIVDCVTAIQDACTWVEEHKIGFELLASAIGVVTTALGAYTIAQTVAKAGGVAAIATNAATTVGYYALCAAEAVATAGASAFGAVMAFVTSPITLVVAAIAAVIAVIVLCVKHWDEIKAKTLEVATMISEKWEDIKAAIAEKVASMVATVTTKFNEIKSTVASKVSDVYNKVKETFENIKNTISTKVMEVYNKVKETFEKIKTSIQEAMQAAKDTVDKMWKKIKNVFSDALSVGKKIVDDIKQGISDAWDGLVSWFNGLWDSLFGKRNVDVNVNANGSGVNGSHASGLAYVPFDGYIAELHKGEMVVPAAEAKMLRGGTQETSASNDIASLLVMIFDAIQEGNSRESVLKLNNREFGRLVRGVT